MLDIYYNEKELEKTKINVDTDDAFDFMSEVATMIDGTINMVAVKYYAPEDRQEITKRMKALLMEMMTYREGTGLESFEEALGICE